jgi:hypothetical protein
MITTKHGIQNMRNLVPILSVSLLAAVAFAQSVNLPAGNSGGFTNSGDVGNPAGKGSTEFNAANGQYRITGSGANIWGKEDQFQYVWREMSGNFVVNATLQFLGQGEEHRKAGIMLRQTLDTDSPYGDFLIHGSGMPALQWRPNKGENTNTFDMPFNGPGKYRLKLVRNGVGISSSLAKDGGAMVDMARTEVAFKGPILVGLVVCAHKADAAETVIFSDVSVEALAVPAATKK